MEVDHEWDEDDRFVSYVELPTLQTMASYSLARAMVFNFISRLPKSTLTETYKLHTKIQWELDDYYEEYIASKKLPRSIQELIRECLLQVRSNLIKSDEHLRCKCWSNGSTIEFNPEHFVWLPNGEIDEEKSAFKMLSFDGLSDVQKFVLMSEFCMEDELATFDVSKLPEDFVKMCTFRRNDTSFYWLCYLKNELDKLAQAVRDYNLFYNSDSVDKNMAKKCSNWTAFLYFWNRLGAKDQTKLAIELLTKPSGAHLNKIKIISMMTSDQQREILSRIPEVLIRNSGEYSDSPRFIRWVWKHSMSSMTDEKFSKIILNLLRGKVHIEERMDTLIEIWNTASDQLRNYVAHNGNVSQRVLRQFLPETEYTRSHGGYGSTSSESVFRDVTPCPSAFHFLRLLVLQRAEDTRIWFLLYGVRKFAAHIGDPRPFEEIFQVILDDRHVHFKAFVMEIDEMRTSCNKLIRRNKFDELITKLRFYLPDEESVFQYLKKIFKKPGGGWAGSYLNDSESWEMFTKGMDKLFPDPTQALQMTKLFVKSSASALASTSADDERLESVQKITETVLNKRELAEFKQSMAKALAKAVNTLGYSSLGSEHCSFNAKHFIDCAVWCCNDNQKSINNFKTKILPVDVIFNKIFEFIKECYNRDEDYRSDMLKLLDEYLKWYKPNDEERKAYKIQRINNPSELLIFEWLVDYQHDESSDEPWKFLDELIRWGCEGDQKAMDEFKAKNPKFVRPTVDSKE